MLSSDATEAQLIIQAKEGFASAASAIRQLSTVQRNSDFIGMALIVDEISKNMFRLATSRSMSEDTLKFGLGRVNTVLGNA